MSFSEPNMKRRNTRNEYVTITVVDRRDNGRMRESKHNVAIIRRTKDLMVFQDNWLFPVPASRRRFYLGNRELSVEESGKVPDRNLFEFLGVFTGGKVKPFHHKPVEINI